MRLVSMALVVPAFTFAVLGACSARPVDRDFTQEVEKICADYCSINLACREPPWFESYEECEDLCLETPYVYNDTECGEARRALTECVGSTATCEVYNDTLNVHADDYTCKAENDHYHSLKCGQSDEDPFPQGAP